MKRPLPRRKLALLVVLFALIPAALLICSRIGGRAWYLTSLLLICIPLIVFFLAFEARRPQARELIVLAVLCALAVASRSVFAAVPHFKPMAAIIMISGLAFGPAAGSLVGAVSGFVSNFLFGQGPWTPWQMFAYGVAGALAGLLTRLGPRRPKRLPMALLGFFAILMVVGPLLDTCALFTMTGEITPSAAATIYLSGLPVNAVHGLATALTLVLFADPMLDILDRLRIKYGMMEEEP